MRPDRAPGRRALADEDQKSGDDKPQGVRRGVRRAVAAGVLLLSGPRARRWPWTRVAGRRTVSTQPAFMVVLGLSHLLFCLILLPVRAAYLRRSGSKQPPSVGICSAAWGYGFVAGAAWFCGAVLVFVAGEDIGVTVADRRPLFADGRGIMGLILLGRGRARVAAALTYIGAMLGVCTARRSCSSRGRAGKGLVGIFQAQAQASYVAGSPWDFQAQAQARRLRRGVPRTAAPSKQNRLRSRPSTCTTLASKSREQ